MKELEIEQEAGDQATSPTIWKGAAAIHLAHQMNERCVDLFCELAITKSSEAQWPFLISNRDLWHRLDGEARRRLATFPFVIVDIRFGDESWWWTIESRKAARSDGVASIGAMPTLPCECLALETLMFAWQVARDDSRVAHMVFGMAPTVADRIASLSMQEVRTIAIQSAQVLRVRWGDKPKFWRELLIAASDADDAAMSVLKLHAGRRFLGEAGRVGFT